MARGRRVDRRTKLARKPMIPGNGRNGRDCPPGHVPDCSGDGDCCPEEWIGDGYCDGVDQAYGCDLTCYASDGGDCCGEIVPADDCVDNLCNGSNWMNALGWTCADYEEHPALCCDYVTDEMIDPICGTTPQESCCICGSGNGGSSCPTGQIKDCNDNCCPETFIGDGFCDGPGTPTGSCDFSCATFSCDGGDCVDECGVCNGPGPPCKGRKKRLDPITRQRGGGGRAHGSLSRQCCSVGQNELPCNSTPCLSRPCHPCSQQNITRQRGGRGRMALGGAMRPGINPVCGGSCGTTADCRAGCECNNIWQCVPKQRGGGLPKPWDDG